MNKAIGIALGVAAAVAVGLAYWYFGGWWRSFVGAAVAGAAGMAAGAAVGRSKKLARSRSAPGPMPLTAYWRSRVALDAYAAAVPPGEMDGQRAQFRIALAVLLLVALFFVGILLRPAATG